MTACCTWRSTLARFAWFAALSGVVILSLTPVDHLPPQVFDVWDKAQHAFGFSVLAVLGVWAYPRRVGRLALGLLALGGVIEVAQSMTGWRYGDAADWVADAVGVMVGVPVGLHMRAVLRRWESLTLHR
jgi:VanZ family protein